MKDTNILTSPVTAADLESAYVWSVNCAVASGSTDLAAELVGTYEREVHQLDENGRLRAA